MPVTNAAPWIEAINRSAHKTGSIHDDAAAQRLGFPKAVVGAGQHVPMATKAAVEVFGKDWYERGFMQARFASPMYHGERIRCVISEIEPTALDDRPFDLRVEKQGSDDVPFRGYLGLARSSAAAVAPWERPGARPVPAVGARDPWPEVALGTEFAEGRHTFGGDPRVEVLDQVDDRCPWYRGASPSGPPVITTTAFISASRHARAPAPIRMNSPMNAHYEVVHMGPVLAGTEYTFRARLVEKGFSGRTAFRTVETDVVAPDGRTLVRSRQMLRWFPARDAGVAA